jgi:hypothetical protein
MDPLMTMRSSNGPKLRDRCLARRAPRFARRIAVAIACLALVLVVCGDDGDDGGDERAAEAACGPYYQINAALSGAGDPSTVPAMLEELEMAIPSDIDEPLTTMITTARTVIDGGMQDQSPLETPEFAAAVAEVEAWMFGNCAFDARVEVEGC